MENKQHLSETLILSGKLADQVQQQHKGLYFDREGLLIADRTATVCLKM